MMDRYKLRATVALAAGPSDPDGMRWPIVVLAAGPAKNAGPSGLTLYYDPATLARDGARAFDGAVSRIDHPPLSGPDPELPEGSIRDRAGVVENVRFDPQVGDRGALVGTFVAVNRDVRQLALDASAAGVLDKFVGFSIMTAGRTEVRMVDGIEYEVVTELAPGGYVDIVTEPAAGGRFILAASLRASGADMDWTQFLAAKGALSSALLAAVTDEDARKLLADLELPDEHRAAIEQGMLAARADAAQLTKAEPQDQDITSPEPVAVAPQPQSVATPEPTPAPAPTVAAPSAPEPVQIAASNRPSQAQVELEALIRRAQQREREAFVKAAFAEAGFDEATRIDLRASCMSAATEADAQSLIDQRSTYLRTLRASTDGAFMPVHIKAGTDAMDAFVAKLDRSFTRRGSDRFHTLRQAAMAFPNYDPRQVATMSDTQLATVLHSRFGTGTTVNPIQNPRIAGEDGPFVFRESVGWVPLRASISTSTLGEVYADRAHKSFQIMYEAVSDWDHLLAMASSDLMLPDFKAHRLISLSEYADLSTVSEGGTYPLLADLVDVEESIQLNKYGAVADMTLEAMRDPDGGGLFFVPKRLAHAMARTVRELIIDTITTTNANLGQDATTLYHANHNNTGTTALTIDGLNTTRTAMRDQTAAGSSAQLGPTNDPRFIIVPTELRALADRITNPPSPYVASPTNAGSDASLSPLEYSGKLTVIDATHHTDANNWFAVADPTKMPTFAVARLQGVPQPEMFQQFDPESDSMFDADKAKIKIRFWIDVAPEDYRGFYRQVVS